MTFYYRPGGPEVMRRVNLHVGAGEILGVVLQASILFKRSVRESIALSGRRAAWTR